MSFQERVGVCYCAHKQQRLAVAAAFYRARKYGRAQALALLDAVDRMTVTQHHRANRRSPMTQGISSATVPEGKKYRKLSMPISAAYRRALEVRAGTFFF